MDFEKEELRLKESGSECACVESSWKSRFSMEELLFSEQTEMISFGVARALE